MERADRFVVLDGTDRQQCSASELDHVFADSH